MKKKISKYLIIILLLVCAGSTFMYFYHSGQSKQAAESYEEAAYIANVHEKEAEIIIEPEKEEIKEEIEIAEVREDVIEPGWYETEITDDEYMKLLEETDLAALREINEDVLAWIVIPDTQLSYPLMRGKDNKYYLEHTWKGEISSAGSIFMERLNSEDFSNYHTVIYGHRMADGTMFGSLKHYTTEEHFKQHPYVYIYDDNGAHRYEIFAAYEAPVGSRTYQVGFTDDENKKEFLNYCAEKSVVDTGIMPAVEDKIITLSTCTAAGSEKSRWVVQARLCGNIVE